MSSKEYGYTKAEKKFAIPTTLDTVRVFYPKNLNLVSGFTVLVAFFWIYLTLFGGLSRWTHVLIFFFWRFCYNVGLGFLLRIQSESGTLTSWYKRFTGTSSLISRVVTYLATLGYLSPSYTHNPSKYPDEFNTWIVFKHLVNFVLANDSICYILLGYKCFTLPRSLDPLVILQYTVGFLLGAFNYWAKVDAHRCIGEYCWYWGDFFYQKKQKLTFDGIFELFPHPMYTVGYALYYGYSLICRSYTMLFVSLGAHLMQLAFLVLVEEPHIQRTYGVDAPSMNVEKFRILYEPKLGLLQQRDPIFLFNFDPFRLQDCALFVFVVYSLLFTFSVQDPSWCIAQVAIWRGIHWIGLGSILWRQSKYQWWTQRYLHQGKTLQEAFNNWKGIYNLSSTMNIFVFLECCIRFLDLRQDWMSPSFWARLSLGALLILLSLYTSLATYRAVGDFGWFYGDFFISTDIFQQSISYTGIYRFVNNPDALTGYAGLYGLALVTSSWVIFSLALASQFMNALFLQIVEVPHMQKLYSERVRKKGPIERVSSEVFSKVVNKDELTKLAKNFRQDAREVRQRATAEILTLYKKFIQEREEEQKKSPRVSVRPKSPKFPISPQSPQSPQSPTRRRLQKQEVELRATEKLILGQSLHVFFKTNKDHSTTDWIGIYDVNTPSLPGMSKGKWKYTGVGESGEIVFPSSALPETDGMYEIRYHQNNQYKVLKRIPLVIEPRDDDKEDDERGDPNEEEEEEEE